MSGRRPTREHRGFERAVAGVSREATDVRAGADRTMRFAARRRGRVRTVKRTLVVPVCLPCDFLFGILAPTVSLIHVTLPASTHTGMASRLRNRPKEDDGLRVRSMMSMNGPAFVPPAADVLVAVAVRKASPKAGSCRSARRSERSPGLSNVDGKWLG